MTPAFAEARRHTVREGQTLAAIARRYRVAVVDIAAANRLRNARLRPGQVLDIPDEGEIYVRRGETLSHVARRVQVNAEDLARANRLRRGRPLRAGQRLVLPGYTEAERIDRDFGDPEVPGRVTLVRGDERIQVQLVDTEGRVVEASLEPLGRLMRRHEGDEVVLPNPRLALLLAKISDHFGGRAIRVVSGFRTAGGYTRESSRHTSGRATDIRVQGVPNRTLWEVCRRLNHTGCGFYPRSTFVHVDARLTRTQWVDWSRPGQRPRYGTLRGPANRRRRRRMPRPRVDGDVPLSLTIVMPNGQTRTFEDTQDSGPDGDEAELDGEDTDGAETETGTATTNIETDADETSSADATTGGDSTSSAQWPGHAAAASVSAIAAGPLSSAASASVVSAFSELIDDLTDGVSER